MKLQLTKNDQYIITLPKQIVLALNWAKGDKLTFKLDNKKLAIGKE